jgi:hypothetical protein
VNGERREGCAGRAAAAPNVAATEKFLGFGGAFRAIVWVDRECFCR